MKESEIVEKIENDLRAHGAYFVNVHGSGYSSTGTPDILAVLDGRFWGIEVKRPGNQPTVSQFRHLMDIHRAGGVALVGYDDFSVDAVKNELTPVWDIPQDEHWAFDEWFESSTRVITWSGSASVDEGDYGTEMARKRREANDARREAQALKESQPKRKKSTSVIDPWPMDRHDGSSFDWIDWSLNTEVSDYLVDHISTQSFQILKLPTGLGKTVQGVRSIGEYQKRLGHQIYPIILAPKSVIDKGGWMKTIQSWNDTFPENQIRPYMIETYARLRGMIRSGDSSASAKNLRQIVKDVGKRSLIVIDEVHNVKTPTSGQTKALNKLKLYPMIGLSATPLTNDVISDGLSYLILSGLYTSKSNFEKKSGLDGLKDNFGRYMVYDKKGQFQPERWPFYSEFLNQLNDVMYAPELDMSTIELPDVDDRLHQIPIDPVLSDQEKSLYRAWSNGAFESPTDFSMALVETIGRAPRRLDTLVEELGKPGTVQPLVFYWHNSTLDAIRERLDAEGIGYQIISGAHSAADVDFDRDDPILVQYQAGSEGIEMPRSNCSIFYQNQNSYSRLVQSRGRNRRRGHSHEVRHVSFVAYSAFDEMLFQRLMNREETTDKIFADLAVQIAEENA